MDLSNPVITAIRTRRSIRKYRNEPVAREVLEAIVDCGRLAPTANNRQTWEFVVVTTPEKLRRLGELATHGKFIAEAAACIVVCGNPENSSVYLDGAAATENMLLAIHSLGLASCWVQTFKKAFPNSVKEMLGIPEHLVLVSMVPIAFSAQAVKMPTKRPLAEVLHWERY